MAVLMLPSAVLTHLKAGVSTALRPDPVRIGWWVHPASATPRKQPRPSLTTVLGGSRLRRARLFDLLAPEAVDPAQLQAHRLALGRGLHGGDDRRLAGRAAAAFATGAFATEIGIVDLDPTGQAFARIPLHHLHELVFELPGGVLGHTEAAAEFEAGDPTLAIDYPRHEPCSSRRQFPGGAMRTCGSSRSGDSHRRLVPGPARCVPRAGQSNPADRSPCVSTKHPAKHGIR